MTDQSLPTPSDLVALMTQAQQLAVEIDAAHAALVGASDKATQHVGYQLGEGAGHVRQAARQLAETARDLEFVLAVRSRPHCAADWGCCPEHGATLTATGGRSWCTASGCGRSWAWDRLGLPCDEPPAFRLTDPQGGGGLLCASHAIAARVQVIGGRLDPIESTEEGEG